MIDRLTDRMDVLNTQAHYVVVSRPLSRKYFVYRLDEVECRVTL